MTAIDFFLEPPARGHSLHGKTFSFFSYQQGVVLAHCRVTDVMKTDNFNSPALIRFIFKSKLSMHPKSCIVGRLTLASYLPDTTSLRAATVCGQSVVVGDHYDNDTLGVFIPDGAIIPDKLAEEMWVKGRLAGKNKDRVKARSMKGVFSAGLFYGSRFFIMKEGEKVYQDGPSWNPEWKEGQDVTAELGVTFES